MGVPKCDFVFFCPAKKGENMDTRHLIDWFSFSILGDYSLSDVFPHEDNLPCVASVQPAEMIPLRRYGIAAALSPAGRIDIGSGQQGKLVTFTGGDLAALELTGVNILELIEKVVRSQYARVARIDLASDIVNAGAMADDIYAAWKNGGVKTRAGKVTRIEAQSKSGSLGVTVSIGSRSSERFVRVYDKGIQTEGKGEYGKDWLRVEVEAKGRYARSIAAAVFSHGVGPTIKTVILSYVTIGDLQWWNDLWENVGSGASILKPGRKVTESDVWLHTVALANVCEAIEGHDAIVVSQVIASLRSAGVLTD